MIHIGDCLEVMRGMAAGSVQTCVTSPPYYGLRDYGAAGQIGLEDTPAEYVARLVAVFREVRRLLRDDGTLWLNLGDSYATDSKWGGSTGGKAAAALHGLGGGGRNKTATGLPDKNLIGIPWRVAFALQEDGWFLRQDIIWAKPNPMPESVTDRCTKAHEYLFLLSKSPRYYFDQRAIREQATQSSMARWAQDIEGQAGSRRVPGKTNGAMKAVGGRSRRDSFARNGAVSNHMLPGQSAAQHRRNRGADTFDTDGRNKRSVWTVATRPFRDAHFATFPEQLIEPCILAGAPAGGLVLDPFMGAGTTAVVAERLGRQWLGCELNPEYAEIAEARIRVAQQGFAFGEIA